MSLQKQQEQHVSKEFGLYLLRNKKSLMGLALRMGTVNSGKLTLAPVWKEWILERPDGLYRGSWGKQAQMGVCMV